jgi:HSP20 family protein
MCLLFVCDKSEQPVCNTKNDFIGGHTMQLMKWNPARDIFGGRHNLDSFFDDFFYPSRKSTPGEGLWNLNPVVDIYEEQDNIVIKAELPGVAKEGITVDVKGRVLTLKGERSADNEIKEEKFYRREREYGRFERAFTLPGEVNPDSVKAEYTDGVLKISVPKPESHKPKQITVH